MRSTFDEEDGGGAAEMAAELLHESQTDAAVEVSVDAVSDDGGGSADGAKEDAEAAGAEAAEEDEEDEDEEDEEEDGEAIKVEVVRSSTPDWLRRRACRWWTSHLRACRRRRRRCERKRCERRVEPERLGLGVEADTPDGSHAPARSKVRCDRARVPLHLGSFRPATAAGDGAAATAEEDAGDEALLESVRRKAELFALPDFVAWAEGAQRSSPSTCARRCGAAPQLPS